MGMFSEVATDSTVHQMCVFLARRLKREHHDETVRSELRLVGRHALTLFEWDTPPWAAEYKALFAERPVEDTHGRPDAR